MAARRSGIDGHSHRVQSSSNSVNLPQFFGQSGRVETKNRNNYNYQEPERALDQSSRYIIHDQSNESDHSSSRMDRQQSSSCEVFFEHEITSQGEASDCNATALESGPEILPGKCHGVQCKSIPIEPVVHGKKDSHSHRLQSSSNPVNLPQFFGQSGCVETKNRSNYNYQEPERALDQSSRYIIHDQSNESDHSSSRMDRQQSSSCEVFFEHEITSQGEASDRNATALESGPEILPGECHGVCKSIPIEPVVHGKLVQQIEGELTCTICLGMFVEPKVLPCLHTYCKKCVERIAQHSTSIVCPQCREKHTLPSGRVDKLLTSFTFTNLVKLLEVHKADAKNLVCENGLDTNPAVSRCVDCQAYLCKSCSQTHRRMLATKQHKVFSLDEIRSKGEKCFQKPRHCPIHENEILKLYCRTCSKTICGDCTYVDHRSHQYVFIKDVQEELKQSLREKLNSMKRLAGEAKNKKEGAQKVVEEHDTKVTSIRTHVDRTFGELSELVRTCHTKVLHDLDQQAKMRKKIHTTNVEEAELTHTRLTSIVTFIERLLQSSDACEISTMANYTLDQCKKLEANQKGAVEESCDWTLDGVEKSKDCLQGVAITHVIPPTVHNKGHSKPGTSKRTQHSQQQNWTSPRTLYRYQQHY